MFANLLIALWCVRTVLRGPVAATKKLAGESQLHSVCPKKGSIANLLYIHIYSYIFIYTTVLYTIICIYIYRYICIY